MARTTKKKAVTKPKPAQKATGEVVRLNIGAGDIAIDGYIPIDRKLGGEAYPLNYADGTVDEIRASHVLEHFSHTERLAVLADWVRVLKPGGILKIAVPDFKMIAINYLRGEPIPTEGYTMGGHLDQDDYHKSIYDAESLAEDMMTLGLTSIRRWESEVQDCAALPVSLNLMAIKPHGTAEFNSKEVHAVMSVPRYMPTLNARCAFNTCSNLGLKLTMGQGAYWHKVITDRMVEAIENPEIKYVLTLDFDSVFDAADVVELYRIMEALPSIDAVAAIEAKRGEDKHILLFPLDGKKAYVHGHQTTVTLVKSAHFGLTLFRADSLRNFPHPWMEGHTDPKTGLWSGECRDHDMDFWERWNQHGLKCAVANRVRIGHIEERIAWVNDNFEIEYQTVGDWAANGKPVGVNQRV